VPLCLDLPDANIIIRSSDQANYRVHKSVLAVSSPFFKDLLSLPQPPDVELVDGLPVVALPEDSGLLNSLISLLYPIAPVIPDSYQKMFALLAVCQKYEMEEVQSYIRFAIKHGKFPAPVKAEGFSAYAIASGRACSRSGGCGSSCLGSTDDIRIAWRRLAIIQRAGSVRLDSLS
jgi:hypothetical protein